MIDGKPMIRIDATGNNGKGHYTPEKEESYQKGVYSKTNKLINEIEKHTAEDFLQCAKDIMKERGKTYDNDSGERSMAKTVKAFNVITDNNLTESDGWLIMLLLKQVRQASSPMYHEDSAMDSVSYAALLAESLAR